LSAGKGLQNGGDLSEGKDVFRIYRDLDLSVGKHVFRIYRDLSAGKGLQGI